MVPFDLLSAVYILAGTRKIRFVLNGFKFHIQFLIFNDFVINLTSVFNLCFVGACLRDAAAFVQRLNDLMAKMEENVQQVLATTMEAFVTDGLKPAIEQKRQYDREAMDYDNMITKHRSMKKTGKATPQKEKESEQQLETTKEEYLVTEKATMELLKQAAAKGEMLTIVKVTEYWDSMHAYFKEGVKFLETMQPKIERYRRHIRDLTRAATTALPVSPRSDRRVFKVPLVKLCEREQRRVPALIVACCNYLKEHGLETQGIFRVSPTKDSLDDLKGEIDQERGYDFTEINNPHVISGLLKAFLRELPDPIFTFEKYSKFMEASKLPTTAEQVGAIEKLVKSLAEPNYKSLQHVSRLCRSIDARKEDNKMTIANLATVLTPNLLYTSIMDPNNMVQEMEQANRIYSLIVENYDVMFPEDDLDSDAVVIPSAAPNSSRSDTENTASSSSSARATPTSPRDRSITLSEVSSLQEQNNANSNLATSPPRSPKPRNRTVSLADSQHSSSSLSASAPNLPALTVPSESDSNTEITSVDSPDTTKKKKSKAGPSSLRISTSSSNADSPPSPKEGELDADGNPKKPRTPRSARSKRSLNKSESISGPAVDPSSSSSLNALEALRRTVSHRASISDGGKGAGENENPSDSAISKATSSSGDLKRSKKKKVSVSVSTETVPVPDDENTTPSPSKSPLPPPIEENTVVSEPNTDTPSPSAEPSATEATSDETTTSEPSGDKKDVENAVLPPPISDGDDSKPKEENTTTVDNTSAETPDSKHEEPTVEEKNVEEVLPEPAAAPVEIESTQNGAESQTKDNEYAEDEIQSVEEAGDDEIPISLPDPSDSVSALFDPSVQSLIDALVAFSNAASDEALDAVETSEQVEGEDSSSPKLVGIALLSQATRELASQARALGSETALFVSNFPESPAIAPSIAKVQSMLREVILAVKEVSAHSIEGTEDESAISSSRTALRSELGTYARNVWTLLSAMNDSSSQQLLLAVQGAVKRAVAQIAPTVRALVSTGLDEPLSVLKSAMSKDVYSIICLSSIVDAQIQTSPSNRERLHEKLGAIPEASQNFWSTAAAANECETPSEYGQTLVQDAKALIAALKECETALGECCGGEEAMYEKTKLREKLSSGALEAGEDEASLYYSGLNLDGFGDGACSTSELETQLTLALDDFATRVEYGSTSYISTRLLLASAKRTIKLYISKMRKLGRQVANMADAEGSLDARAGPSSSSRPSDPQATPRDSPPMDLSRRVLELADIVTRLLAYIKYHRLDGSTAGSEAEEQKSHIVSAHASAAMLALLRLRVVSCLSDSPSNYSASDASTHSQSSQNGFEEKMPAILSLLQRIATALSNSIFS